jgi:hydrogenase maturation protein HypF
VEARRIRIRGTVQGVGFRPWVFRTAEAAGVTGTVCNDSLGVTIEAFGSVDRLRAFVDALRTDLPPAARIAELTIADLDASDAPGEFAIAGSRAGDERLVSIPPDLATCDRCASEIQDPADRRYRYPFTNCTDCGPRFTIATDVPYDRAATTMARFVMCPACRREYDSVRDRRFHAQPNACPVCGPTLQLYTHTGELIGVDDAIASAAEALAAGLIVAVKGLGGFHLACDATDGAAVARLRERKRRDEKPLAVMVRDLEAAERYGMLDAESRRLLTSVERPIVLVPKREADLASNVAPGNRYVGLFLPYTPLHHLLLHDAGVPLVMTSANLSEEPIAFRNDEAVRRLGAIADLFLMHDRDIQTRCDDSVAAVVAGRGVLLRRSRGYVPRPVPRTRGFARPVLACGALLKNTFCLGSGTNAWLGPHIGDLENLETFESYEDAITRMERFLAIVPEVVACDLHPDYLSTRYARERQAPVTIAVQHHHAHVVSAMAEHGLEGPVIGIAYDGTGYGTDGTMWGGEILVATEASYERAATFRPIALAGGDRAIREPWRIALALALDAYDGCLPSAVQALFDTVSHGDARQVAELLRARLNAPLARGAGRYFDAFGALFLGRRRAAFEGQIALEWDQAADPSETRRYPFEIADVDGLRELDLRPAFRAAVRDALNRVAPGMISAAFHNTLVEATAALVRAAAAVHGRLPVVASGGCFQNARLAERVRAALVPEFDVRLHGDVPPGDGGIALGQAVIADARVRGSEPCV